MFTGVALMGAGLAFWFVMQWVLNLFVTGPHQCPDSRDTELLRYGGDAASRSDRCGAGRGRLGAVSLACLARAESPRVWEIRIGV